MARIIEEIKQLHAEGLYDDLLIVISLVLSTNNVVGKSFTPSHLYQLYVFYGDACKYTRDYKRAERCYKEALGIKRSLKRDQSEKTSSSDLASELSLRYKLYEVYRELRQYRAAIAVLDAVQAKDRTAAINMALAKLYTMKGMDRSAITCYKEVLRNYPYALEAARGLLLLGVKKVNLASLLLKSTINDEDWSAGWLSAQCSMAERNWPAAIQQLTLLESHCCHNTNLLNLKAEAHYYAGQLMQAKRIWQEVFEGDPLTFKNADLLGLTYVDSHEKEKLEWLSNHMHSIHPSSAESWLVSGSYSLLSKKFTQTIFMAQKALSQNPKCYPAYILKGLALFASDHTGSVQHFREAIRLEPYRLEGYKALVEALLRCNQVREAIAMASSACRQIGQNATTIYLYGNAIAKDSTMNREKATAYLEKSIASDNTLTGPVYALAEIWLQSQRHEKAKALLENCLYHNSTSRLHQLYGEALLMAGDRVKAMHEFDKALSLDANNKKASEGMERAERNADSLGAGDSYVGDSLDRSSEVDLNGEDVSWSDPDVG